MVQAVMKRFLEGSGFLTLLFLSHLSHSYAKLEGDSNDFIDDLLANVLAPRGIPTPAPTLPPPQVQDEQTEIHHTRPESSNEVDQDKPHQAKDSNAPFQNQDIVGDSKYYDDYLNSMDLDSPKEKRQGKPVPEFDVGEDQSVDTRQSGRSQPQYNPDDLTPGNRQGGLKPPGLMPPWQDSETTTSTFRPVTIGTATPATRMPAKPTPPSEPPLPADWRLLPKIKIDPSSIFGSCGAIEGTQKNTENPKSIDIRKTCFAYPPGCADSRKCRVAAAISPSYRDVKYKTIADRKRKTRQVSTAVSGGANVTNSQWIRIEMEATAPEGFVAIGFSKDVWMGDDLVMYCGQGPIGHLTTIHMGYNKKYHNVMEKDEFNFSARVIRKRGYAQDNGVVACDFELLFPNPLNQTEAGSDKEWHVFLAFGRLYNYLDFNDTNYGTLLFHHMAVVSSSKISHESLKNNPQILLPRNRGLIRDHSLLSIFSLCLCVPWSMFIAKYGREAYSNILFSEIPQWAFMHMIFSILALLTMIPGMILIALELEWEWRSISGRAIVHSVLGIFASMMLFCNVIIGAAGFGITGQNRRIKSIVEGVPGIPIESERTIAHYFRWVHWYFGQCTYFFAMGSLFLAPGVRRANIPCGVMYIAALQVIVHILTHIYMALHTYQLVMEIDGKYVLRRVLPGPMLPWVENDLLMFENEKEFYALDIWEGRRVAIKFYCATTLICIVGIIVLMGHFVPLVLCRRSIGAYM